MPRPTHSNDNQCRIGALHLGVLDFLQISYVGTALARLIDLHSRTSCLTCGMVDFVQHALVEIPLSAVWTNLGDTDQR